MKIPDWRWLKAVLRFLGFSEDAPPTKALPPPLQTAPEDETKPIFLPVHRDPPKPELDDKLTIDFVNPSGEQIPFECGHTDFAYFEMSVFGNVLKPKDSTVPPQFCRACGLDALKHEERCCLCGGIISPGSGIALYEEPNLDRTWHAAYILKNEKRYYLGCMGWDCCESGGYFSGRLTNRGVSLAFSALNVAEEVFRTGKVIHVDI